MRDSLFTSESDVYRRQILTSKVDARTVKVKPSFNKHCLFHYVYISQCLSQGTRKDGRGPKVVVSTADFHARVRGSVPGFGGLKETHVSSPSNRKTQYCGEAQWGSVLCLRPPGLEFRILCLEGSVISPSWGCSPGPNLAYMCTKVAWGRIHFFFTRQERHQKRVTRVFHKWILTDKIGVYLVCSVSMVSL